MPARGDNRPGRPVEHSSTKRCLIHSSSQYYCGTSSRPTAEGGCRHVSRGDLMPKAAPAFVLTEAILNAYDTNDRINQYMIENLPAEAWRAETPDGKGRTIAAIVAHLHNVRVMWLKAAKSEKIPEQLRSEE